MARIVCKVHEEHFDGCHRARLAAEALLPALFERPDPDAPGCLEERREKILRAKTR